MVFKVLRVLFLYLRMRAQIYQFCGAGGQLFKAILALNPGLKFNPLF